jgi:hypothetical protein
MKVYLSSCQVSLSLIVFQSLILVCSSSHELLILGISVRVFLMQWFPLAFCMIVFRHTVGLLWTSDQPVSETSTSTGQHIHALSRIRTRDPSNQAATDLRLRPRGYRGRHVKYSGRKITESLGNVTVRGEKDGKSKGRARCPTVSLSMHSITENIYYSQLSSVAILLQPERNCFTSCNTSKGLCFLSVCAIVLRSLPPTCLLLTVNEDRCYFASTVRVCVITPILSKWNHSKGV